MERSGIRGFGGMTPGLHSVPSGLQDYGGNLRSFRRVDPGQTYSHLLWLNLWIKSYSLLHVLDQKGNSARDQNQGTAEQPACRFPHSLYGVTVSAFIRYPEAPNSVSLRTVSIVPLTQTASIIWMPFSGFAAKAWMI
jgi:hypothetical protein